MLLLPTGVKLLVGMPLRCCFAVTEKSRSDSKQP